MGEMKECHVLQGLSSLDKKKKDMYTIVIIIFLFS